MMNKIKKTYEVPTVTVTNIETEDIIAASLLIGSEISLDNLLGSGEIEWDLIQ